MTISACYQLLLVQIYIWEGALYKRWGSQMLETFLAIIFSQGFPQGIGQKSGQIEDTISIWVSKQRIDAFNKSCLILILKIVISYFLKYVLLLTTIFFSFLNLRNTRPPD